MSIEAVSFDCAGTLIDVEWDPAQIAVDSARAVGLEPPQHAYDAYQTALRSRWGEFQRLNTQRDASVTEAFWQRMTDDWCEAIGFGHVHASRINEAAQSMLFGEDSCVFRVYSDTVLALESLQSHGTRMGVLSNWDISLHKTLEVFGLSRFFEFAIASLEEGVEKPHPDLFRIMVDRFDLEPQQILHVGDDPIADVRGARDAGCSATLIDRGSDPAPPHRVQSLGELIGVIEG